MNPNETLREQLAVGNEIESLKLQLKSWQSRLRMARSLDRKIRYGKRVRTVTARIAALTLIK